MHHIQGTQTSTPFPHAHQYYPPPPPHRPHNYYTPPLPLPPQHPHRGYDSMLPHALGHASGPVLPHVATVQSQHIETEDERKRRVALKKLQQDRVWEALVSPIVEGTEEAVKHAAAIVNDMHVKAKRSPSRIGKGTYGVVDRPSVGKGAVKKFLSLSTCVQELAAHTVLKGAPNVVRVEISKCRLSQREIVMDRAMSSLFEFKTRFVPRYFFDKENLGSPLDVASTKGYPHYGPHKPEEKRVRSTIYEAVAVNILRGVCKGLIFIHGIGQIHGDLTDSNILVVDGPPHIYEELIPVYSSSVSLSSSSSSLLSSSSSSLISSSGSFSSTSSSSSSSSSMMSKVSSSSSSMMSKVSSSPLSMMSKVSSSPLSMISKVSSSPSLTTSASASASSMVSSSPTIITTTTSTTTSMPTTRAPTLKIQHKITKSSTSLVNLPPKKIPTQYQLKRTDIPTLEGAITDPGMMGPDGHALVNRTARPYGEKNPKSDSMHDIHSLGIIMYEFFVGYNVESGSYSATDMRNKVRANIAAYDRTPRALRHELARRNVPPVAHILYEIFQEDRKERISALELYIVLTNYAKCIAAVDMTAPTGFSQNALRMERNASLTTAGVRVKKNYSVSGDSSSGSSSSSSSARTKTKPRKPTQTNLVSSKTKSNSKTTTKTTTTTTAASTSAPRKPRKKKNKSRRFRARKRRLLSLMKMQGKDTETKDHDTTQRGKKEKTYETKETASFVSSSSSFAKSRSTATGTTATSEEKKIMLDDHKSKITKKTPKQKRNQEEAKKIKRIKDITIHPSKQKPQHQHKKQFIPASLIVPITTYRRLAHHYLGYAFQHSVPSELVRDVCMRNSHALASHFARKHVVNNEITISAYAAAFVYIVGCVYNRAHKFGVVDHAWKLLTTDFQRVVFKRALQTLTTDQSVIDSIWRISHDNRVRAFRLIASLR